MINKYWKRKDSDKWTGQTFVLVSEGDSSRRLSCLAIRRGDRLTDSVTSVRDRVLLDEDAACLAGDTACLAGDSSPSVAVLCWWVCEADAWGGVLAPSTVSGPVFFTEPGTCPLCAGVLSVSVNDVDDLFNSSWYSCFASSLIDWRVAVGGEPGDFPAQSHHKQPYTHNVTIWCG